MSLAKLVAHNCVVLAIVYQSIGGKIEVGLNLPN